MAADNKDRLGGKLHDVEAARENQWARKRDEELLEMMRERLHHHACPNARISWFLKLSKASPCTRVRTGMARGSMSPN